MKSCPQCAKCFACCHCRDTFSFVASPPQCCNRPRGAVRPDPRNGRYYAQRQAEAKRMMDDGICDVDIAAAFGVEPETVAQWRRRAKADVWRPVRSERDFSRFPIRRVDGQKRARK